MGKKGGKVAARVHLVEQSSAQKDRRDSPKQLSLRPGPLSAVGWVITAGILFRLGAAIFRTDMIWPDEQFQTIEPAVKAVFGHGVLFWEWQHAYRSWVVPALYIPLIAYLGAAGILGGKGLLIACRSFTAVAGAFVLLGVKRVLSLLGVGEVAKLIALTLLAFSPSMILWSSATLADTWATIAAWAGLPVILSRFRKQSPLNWIAIGFLIGLPAVIKIQLGLWSLGLCLGLVGARVRLSHLLWAAVGFAASFSIWGIADAITYGLPFKSLIEQIATGNEIGKTNGVSPAWSYLAWIVEDQGRGFFLVLLGLLGFALAGPYRDDFRNRLVAKGTELSILILPSLLLVAGHSAIEHKELRFILPMMPVFYVVVGFLAEPFSQWLITKRWAKFAGAVSFCVVVLMSLGGTMARPLRMSSVNTTELEDTIFRDGGLNRAGGSCVILVEQIKVWTRGESVIGAPVRWVQNPLDKIATEDFLACAYAIIPRRQERAFLERSGNHWRALGIAQNGFIAMKRIE